MAEKRIVDLEAAAIEKMRVELKEPIGRRVTRFAT
jgi:hypothetical protein